MVNLAGVWSLVSFVVLVNNEIVARPNGENPLGKITILPEGYISVQITTPGAAPIAGNIPWLDAPNDELARISRPWVSYCGRFTTVMVGEQLQIQTTLDVSLDPSWLPAVQKRNVTLYTEGGKEYMVLTPTESPVFTQPGVNFTATPVKKLTWVREITSCTRKRAAQLAH